MSDGDGRSSSHHKKKERSKEKKKHKRKRDELKDLDKLFSKSNKSGVDPMLEPFGDEAEADLRKKLEKRLKKSMKIDKSGSRKR